MKHKLMSFEYTEIEYDEYRCTQCNFCFLVIDIKSFIEKYGDCSKNSFQKFKFSLINSAAQEGVLLHENQIPLKEKPKKCPKCSADSNNFLEENKDYFNLHVYKCPECEKKFAVGVLNSYLDYYFHINLTYNQAFEKFKKEIKKYGSNVPHFKKIPLFCVHCGNQKLEKQR